MRTCEPRGAHLVAHKLLKTFGVRGADTVPHFRSAGVVVVDAVQVRVLDVPAEGRKEHSVVQHRAVDARDHVLDVLQDRGWLRRERSEAPRRLAIDWEGGAFDVVSVLDHEVLGGRWCVHPAPELGLQCGCGGAA